MFVDIKGKLGENLDYKGVCGVCAQSSDFQFDAEGICCGWVWCDERVSLGAKKVIEN